jgi:hypothetical protein
MSNSAREFPILSRLLSANEQWAKDVEKAQSGFFKVLSKGQQPKVSSPPIVSNENFLESIKLYRSFG